MHFNMPARAALSATIALSALLAPAAGVASAASSTLSAFREAVAAAGDSFDARCRSHNRNYILKKYHRVPKFYTLRCGTSTWGWKHINLDLS